MVAQKLQRLEKDTKKQIDDLKKRRFEVFAVTAGGARAETNCNADMIKTLERQLRDIRSAITHAHDLEYRASK